MAKRVFELAKELSVTSKAIVQKCKAEQIPGVTNHMSSISAGLEATVREWFSSDAGGGTAVETAAKVDLDKVRVKPRKKARKKAPRNEDAVSTTVDHGEEEIAPAGKLGVSAAKRPPAGESEAPEEAPSEIEPSLIPEPAVGAGTPSAPAPVTTAPPQESTTPAEPATETEPRPDHATLRPAAKAPAPTKRGEPEIAAPPQNVPVRPKEVAPQGPKLEVQKPARLSGPKVVRVEAPDVVDAPRGRRPGGGGGPPGGGRMGRGAGVMPPEMEPAREPGGRSPRRSKTKGEERKVEERPGRRSGRGGSQWREQDLLEREERLARSGGFLRQRRRDQKLKSHTEKASTAAQTGGRVKVNSPLTIKELSAVTGVKGADIVKKLFLKGMMANINSAIDDETAQEIMMDYDIELVIEERKTAEQAVVEEFEQKRDLIDERPRHPVITILGHVDHGKTSLLDRIRKANVASGEAGGITQATSAFRVPLHVGDSDKMITFVDTPGHAAFTEMRSRGATMTDIVVLVVAADDGVMPQTIESINHAKAAKVPLIVALNKIDLPGITEEKIQKIYGQLAEHDLNPSVWGGQTEVVKTSAATGEGIQDLLETLDLQAQILELKADFKGLARGVVIESKLEEGRGPTANILVQEGELKVGDTIVVGRAFGRIRELIDDRGQRITAAGPSTPVKISGIGEVPDAGDKFFIVDSIRKAQEAAEQRKERERELELSQPKVTLDSMFAQMSESELKEFLVVLKADVQGSVDAIRSSIEDISTDEIKIRVLHAAVGGITESDVTLAAASGAVILGFNVIPSSTARQSAEQKNVEIRSYQVIYDIVDDVKKAAEGLLDPEQREEVLGHAEVRQVFRVSKVGNVAGCYVTDGTIERNALIRVTRSDIVIEQNRVLEQLKRFKDDVKSVRSGQECGMKIVGYDDIKEGDILECYRRTEVRRTL